MLRSNKDHLGLVRPIAEYIREIVLAATASSKGRLKQSAVRCRRRPAHTKCRGRLLVCERDDGDIEYQCPCCSEKGVIRGWQGSISDLSELRDESRRPGFEIVLDGREYDDLKRALVPDIESDGIIYGATYTENGVILRGSAIDIKSFADCLSYDARHAENSKHRQIMNQVLHRVQSVLGNWSPD